MRAFIDDGFNIAVTIPAAPGQYESVTFTFRPSLSEENAILFDVPDGEIAEQQKRYRAFLAEHIVSWNVQDRTQRVVDIRPEVFARIHPMLRSKMLNYVVGTEPLPEGAEPVAALEKN